MGMIQNAPAYLGVSSVPLPREHQTIQLELLHSCPDSIPERINPAGQNLIVNPKTETSVPHRFVSFDSAIEPVYGCRRGLTSQPSLSRMQEGGAF